ncbi:MAG TPA: PIN domain-containing protein [Longimicrobiales bacterium]|nr:PIN domain-containing protein [Longimicrobiales bacterium]
MADRSFLDTNVLVYTDDADAPGKQAKALDLYERVAREQSGVVSTQVLQEYFVATTRKLGVDPEMARRKVQLFGGLGLVVLDRTQILGAIDLVRLHRFSFWDALIVQAPLDASCRILYSEDLQSGRAIRGLQIRNPFD